jgi:UDPglucose 6-dehydrogenase
VRDVAEYARRGAEIGVMSTVLPGTIRSLILPQVQDHALVYCPQFVGMGTVARDLRNPEFTLIGRGSREPAIIPEVLSGLGDAPVFTVSYETAELAKMIYNTFVSAKVTLANIVQRMASETSAQASDVFRIIRAADQRLGSAAYIGPGMGDGGPCHPRDNVALSWLARRSGMGADLFSAVMESREAYVEWLSDRFVELAAGLPLVLLGTAFKPGTDIEAGSSAVLLANLLGLRGVDVQIVRTPDDLHRRDRAAAFFIGCPEPPFLTFPFPPGSVVVDPWHRVGSPDGVTVHHIGEAAAAREPAAQPAERRIPAQR